MLTPTTAPGLLAHLDELVRAAAATDGGALWRLSAEGRQLDANVIRVLPGARVAEHVEPDVDVLLHVVSGSGRLETASGLQELTPGSVAWLPRGARRSLSANADGLVYLTAHRRRAGLAIRSAAVGLEGGEPACLLDRVCVNCGRLAQESDARFCSRCGVPLPSAS
ncbi:hypothetical protein [Kitasatospora sp. McL0602]|uniref:hypothetical protein n=1 Tax=Kitasatospora sp. McL0602 TaxID=3439530 RepID=UPI003F8AE387